MVGRTVGRTGPRGFLDRAPRIPLGKAGYSSQQIHNTCAFASGRPRKHVRESCE
jgi:hypothetical protein